MFDTFSQRSDTLQPEESISQMNITLRDEDNDIYEDSIQESPSVFPLSKLTNSSRSKPFQSAYFVVNEDTVEQASCFLKVL